MSFKSLNTDELKEVAEFFVVDVEAADAEKGPSKKELLAALAAGDEPVSWEQYNDIYLAAKERELANLAVAAAPDPEPTATVEPAEPVDMSDWVLVKMERQNPTYEIRGHKFTKSHPFASMSPGNAEYIIKNIPGFRLALPSELADYYN